MKPGVIEDVGVVGMAVGWIRAALKPAVQTKGRTRMRALPCQGSAGERVRKREGKMKRLCAAELARRGHGAFLWHVGKRVGALVPTARKNLLVPLAGLPSIQRAVQNPTTVPRLAAKHLDSITASVVF
jgi:hypothetical protein